MKTILIVEDEKALRKALSDKLTNEGYKIIETTDGEEGLDSALREHPDLILLDIVMPNMDGITMLQKLRQDAHGKNIPVIILTNLSDAEKVQQGMENAVFDYLIKADWKLSDLVDKVNQKLSSNT